MKKSVGFVALTSLIMVVGTLWVLASGSPSQGEGSEEDEPGVGSTEPTPIQSGGVVDVLEAVIVDHREDPPVIYTWDNLTLWPDQEEVQRILEDRTIYEAHAWNYTEYVAWYQNLTPDQIKRHHVRPPQEVFADPDAERLNLQISETRCRFVSRQEYEEWYHALTTEYVRQFNIKSPEVVFDHVEEG